MKYEIEFIDNVMHYKSHPIVCSSQGYYAEGTRSDSLEEVLKKIDSIYKSNKKGFEIIMENEVYVIYQDDKELTWFYLLSQAEDFVGRLDKKGG